MITGPSKETLKKTFIIVWRILFIVVVTTYFIKCLDPLHNEMKKRFRIRAAMNFHRALDWLRENTEPDDVVLSSWLYGAQITAHARRPTIATSKVYPSEAKEVAERYRDTGRNFFGAKCAKEALRVVKKYDVKYVFLKRKRRKKYGNRLVHWMERKKPMKGYEFVYQTGPYMIYKVKQDAST